jgi:capsular exopolysaccharide synthesis family protein
MEPLKITPPPETKLHFLDYWRIIRIRKTVILAVFLLVVITATLVTFILPESFASTARIRIERDSTDIPSLTTGERPFMGYDPYFIQTEFEVIQSELILGQVIKNMDLNREWGRKYMGGEMLRTTETMTMLKQRMDLHPVRNTELVEIRVFSENKDEAAAIANAIADAYSKYRKEEREKLSQGGIKALEKRFKQQEAEVDDAQKKVDKLRTELQIPDAWVNAETPTMLITAESLRRLESLRIESQARLVEGETLLQELEDLKEKRGAKELAQAIPSAATDQLLQELLQNLTLMEQSMVVATNDYGPEHPQVIKAKALVADLHKKVNDRVEGFLVGLKAKVDSMKKGLKTLEEQVAEAKSQDITNAITSQPYFQAKQELEQKKRFCQMLYTRLAAENIDVTLPKTVVTIVDNAVASKSAVRPNKPLNIALGVVIGLVVGIGLAFFIEYLDTSVKTIDDVERALQAPVLGVIPQNVGLLIEEGVESPHAEAYRVLRTNLLFSRKDDKLNTVAVVSAGAGEGKSTTVFNLAAVFAQSGQRVLVVDSDLRRPTLHKMLRITNSIGLTNYLLKQNSLVEVIQTSGVPNMDFLASGKLPSSSLGILSSAQMKDLITELKQRYDFVFFDSPPIMGVSDASILASEVDMTLQVIQYRRYPQPMNIRAKQLIEKVGGNLIGIVLNNINMSQDESYYYYSGYYHDYYARGEDEPSGGGRADGEKGEKAKAKVELKQRY